MNVWQTSKAQEPLHFKQGAAQEQRRVREEDAYAATLHCP